MARKNQPKQKRKGVVRDDARDEANKRRFVNQYGVPAQDMPGAEHGQNVVDPPEQMQRNLPQQHGGEMESERNYGEGGLRGSRDISDADDKGGRKKN